MREPHGHGSKSPFIKGDFEASISERQVIIAASPGITLKLDSYSLLYKFFSSIMKERMLNTVITH
jgi:hypothetical protein